MSFGKMKSFVILMQSFKSLAHIVSLLFAAISHVLYCPLFYMHSVYKLSCLFGSMC